MIDNDNVVEFSPRAVRLPGDMAMICARYMEHLRRRNLSRQTINSYRVDLEQFAGYLAGRGVDLIQAVSVDMVNGFVDALLYGEGLSPRSVARKVAALRGLFLFAVDNGVLDERANPMARYQAPKFVKRPTIPPSTESLLRLIESIPADTPLDVRDRALFMLIFDAGLRISEPLRLDLYDADAPPANHVRAVGEVGVVMCRKKGGGTSSKPLDDVTMAYLDEWLAVRNQVPGWGRTQALFIGRNGKRLGRAAVHARLKQHGNRVGLPEVHAHLFRHARGQIVLETLGIHHAQRFLDHKTISTTGDEYAHVLEASENRMIRNHAPLPRGADNSQEAV